MASNKIVDAFTYFNEIHLLELRLMTLKDVVDHFVIAEMNITHGGVPKPFGLEEHLDRLPVPRDHIVYVKIDDAPIVDAKLESEREKIENFQRNGLARGIAQLDLAPDDMVMVSDLDEIPDPRAIVYAVGALEQHATVVFCQLHRKFFINAVADNHSINQCWLGTVATRVGTLAKMTPQNLRRGAGFPRAAFLWTEGRAEGACYVETGGWHLTYFGGGGAAHLKAHSIFDGFHVAEVPTFFVPPRSRHNWQAGRTVPVMAWRQNLDATILPTAPLSIGELTYLPDPVVRDPLRWEWLWWYEAPIDAAMASAAPAGDN